MFHQFKSFPRCKHPTSWSRKKARKTFKTLSALYEQKFEVHGYIERPSAVSNQSNISPMPIFMDRHDVPGITAQEAASAHQKDLQVQDKFDCFGMTYWVDESRGCAFCLVEAPDKQAVMDMHNNSHGLVPHEIIEVDENLVQSFLGRIHDPEMPDGHASEVASFHDPAFRAILIMDLKDSALLKGLLGKEAGLHLFEIFYSTALDLLEEYDGRQVETRGGFIASFQSATQAVDFTLALMDRFHSRCREEQLVPREIKAGISAGLPVAGNEALFGNALELSRMLCFISGSGVIQATSEVRELYQGKRSQVFGTGERVHVLDEEEKAFLSELMKLLAGTLLQNGIRVADISSELGISSARLYRRCKSITGYSPQELIQELRLVRSAELLHTQGRNVSEVAYELDFSTPSYFSKCFKERFGISPTHFLKSVQ